MQLRHLADAVDHEQRVVVNGDQVLPFANWPLIVRVDRREEIITHRSSGAGQLQTAGNRQQHATRESNGRAVERLSQRDFRRLRQREGADNPQLAIRAVRPDSGATLGQRDRLQRFQNVVGQFELLFAARAESAIGDFVRAQQERVSPFGHTHELPIRAETRRENARADDGLPVALHRLAIRLREMHRLPDGKLPTNVQIAADHLQRLRALSHRDLVLRIQLQHIGLELHLAKCSDREPNLIVGTGGQVRGS